MTSSSPADALKSTTQSTFSFKDVLLLLASIALGVGSSIATTTMQAQYALKQAMIDKQMSAVATAASEWHKVLRTELNHYGRLKELVLEFREESKLAAVDVETFAKNWQQAVDQLQTHYRTDGLALEAQIITTHMLFTPEKDLKLREPLSSTKQTDEALSVAEKLRGLRRALQRPISREEKMRLATLLVETAEPYLDSELERIRLSQNGVNVELQEYIRRIGR